MTVHTHSSCVEELSESECRRLLLASRVGRVGLVVGNMASIVPVAFAAVGDDVYFRTSLPNLSMFVRAGRVTFEVDSVDPAFHAGWSVTGFGVARLLEREAVGALDRSHRVRPWAIDEDPVWVAIRLDEVIGRRIVGLVHDGPMTQCGATDWE